MNAPRFAELHSIASLVAAAGTFDVRTHRQPAPRSQPKKDTATKKRRAANKLARKARKRK